MRITKIIGSLLLMAVTISPVFAVSSTEETDAVRHSKERIESRDNWFVNLSVGPQILFSDHDRQASFGKRISPALDIAAGKLFKSGWGVRLMYSGLTAKGATQSGIYSTGEFLGTDKGYTYTQKFSMFNLHADVMYNFTSFIRNEQLNNVWACYPYLGLGLAHIYDSPKQNNLSLNLGLYNTIRITDNLDATFDLRGMFTGDSFDGEKGHRSGEGLLSFTLGVAYNF